MLVEMLVAVTLLLSIYVISLYYLVGSIFSYYLSWFFYHIRLTLDKLMIGSIMFLLGVAISEDLMELPLVIIWSLLFLLPLYVLFRGVVKDINEDFVPRKVKKTNTIQTRGVSEMKRCILCNKEISEEEFDDNEGYCEECHEIEIDDMDAEDE